MANIIINNPITYTNSANILASYGPYEGLQALNSFLAKWKGPVAKGTTFGVIEDGVIKEYWIENEENATTKTVSPKNKVELTDNGFKIGEYTFTIE